MVNVSKKKLDEKTEREIRRRFFKTIIRIGKERNAALFEELLTPVEQIMLAKRLAALFLLAEGIPAYRVARLLKLSSSTTKRYAEELGGKQHQSIVRLVKKKQEREAFWAELEVMLRFGMPEMGRGRWKWLDEIHRKSKK